MKLIIAVFVIICCVSVAYSTPCDGVSGTWMNQLNSTFIIYPVVNNRFTGKYYTAVESKNGSAGLGAQNVAGIYLPSGLLSYSVIYNNGSSAAAWVGECLVCDGQETLFTSWFLRSYTTRDREWTSTMFNQDTYYRIGIPREEDRPPRIPVQGGNNDIDEYVNGNWYTERGEKLNLIVLHRSDIGAFLYGTYSELPAYVFGMTSEKDNYFAVTMTTYDSRTDEVKSWTGHINRTEPISAELLKTSWLKHARVGLCRYAFDETLAGLDQFARYKPTVDSSSKKTEYKRRSFKNIKPFFVNLL